MWFLVISYLPSFYLHNILQKHIRTVSDSFIIFSLFSIITIGSPILSSALLGTSVITKTAVLGIMLFPSVCMQLMWLRKDIVRGDPPGDIFHKDFLNPPFRHQYSPHQIGLEQRRMPLHFHLYNPIYLRTLIWSTAEGTSDLHLLRTESEKPF